MQALIKHSTGNGLVEQRASDGYINATALCKAAGKLWSNYVQNQQTKDFLLELSSTLGIPRVTLVQSKDGNPSTGGGTWVHPQVAIHLAQWASPKFAVQVSQWVYDWLSGKTKALPIHLERYFKNDPKIPTGHFSVLQEAATGLIGKLHVIGFDIPEGWVPDISLGLLFCKYLRMAHGVNTDALPTYLHDYYNGQKPRPAKIYPNKYLELYRHWFAQIWLPIHGVKYFKKKDQEDKQISFSYVTKLADFKALQNGNKPLLG